MIFFYSSEAGQKNIFFQNDEYHYLVRVKRHRVGDTLILQNMKDAIRFFYTIIEITKKTMLLELVSQESFPEIILSSHLAWGMCDAKTIYDTLPALNQLGVKKISFLKTDRSQGNIRLSSEKLNTICIQSSQQCGRNHLLEWEVLDFDDFISAYPHAVLCDISGESILSESISKNIPIMIGPEGGWSEQEKEKIPLSQRFRLATPFVLRSEVAAVIACNRE